MSQPLVLSSANIKLFVNNKLYTSVQSVSLKIDYSERAIYGIDSPYAQEIASGQVTVEGSVSGIRIKYSGGIQAANIRPLWTDIAASPYISIRIQDRSTSEDIVFIPMAKCTSESHTMAAKGIYNLSFNFIGSVPLMALDRAD